MSRRADTRCGHQRPRPVAVWRERPALLDHARWRPGGDLAERAWPDLRTIAGQRAGLAQPRGDTWPAVPALRWSASRILVAELACCGGQPVLSDSGLYPGQRRERSCIFAAAAARRAGAGNFKLLSEIAQRTISIKCW